MRDKITPFFDDVSVCEIASADIIARQNETVGSTDPSEPYSPACVRAVGNQPSAIPSRAL